MQCMKYSKIWLNLTFAALNLSFIRGQKAFQVFHADRVIIRLLCGQGQLSRIWKVKIMWLAKLGKGMLSSVEQVFEGRDEKWAPLKMPAWEARWHYDISSFNHDKNWPWSPSHPLAWYNLWRWPMLHFQ